MPLMPADTWPPISSALYWPDPLYATCSMRRPLVLASTTPTRCPMLPTPELAKNALSGLAFTQATYSGQERAPDIGPNAKPDCPFTSFATDTQIALRVIRHL